MKIAIIFGPYSVSGRPLNFFVNNIWIAERGLSGSDLGVVVTAQNFVKMGHDVSLFTFYVPNTKPVQWEGVKLYEYDQRLTVIDDSFDAVISWNEPDVFRGLTNSSVKICQQMLNDFHYCIPDFDDFVDIWTSPSEMHMQWMQKQLPSNKWRAVPLGSDPSWFSKQEKVRGSVIWLSSPDRGLHLLLQEWPKIKKADPEAHLKIFYHINDIREGELGNRFKYIRYAIEKLKNSGVEYVGSVSRNQITKELSKAMVMIAPLSTITPSEGFSCSTMEACMAGCLPIVGDIDCLGSIYSQAACMIPSPVDQNLNELSNSVIRGLTDDVWRAQIVDKCQKLADEYTWMKHAIRLENLIKEHPKCKYLKELTIIKEHPKFNEMKRTHCFMKSTCDFKGKEYKIAAPAEHPSVHQFYFDEVSTREQLWDIKPDDYILDIGACYGSYTLSALVAGAKQVYAWSPQAHGLLSDKKILEESLRLNGWQDKCIIYDTGLYDKEGWLDCYEQNFYGQEPLSYIKNTDTNTISDLIKVDTLDKWYETEFLLREKDKFTNQTIWMKIDVEGAELEVLLGGKKVLEELSPVILIENHLEASPNIKVRQLLKDVFSYEEIITIPYINRSHSIFKKKEEAKTMIKLNIGSGPNMFPYPDWINYDREDFQFLIDHLLKTDMPNITCNYGYRALAAYIKNNGKVDARVHDLRQGFSQHADNTVDLIYVGQVIEHLNPIFESPKLLKDCYRMLKTGGILRMTTPDLDILIDAYKNGEMGKFAAEQPQFYKGADPSSQLSYIMFGACGHKCTWDYYEGHFFLYSRISMTKFLNDAGFTDIHFFDGDKKSLSLTMLQEVIDEGMTHSLCVEAKK